MDVEQFQDDVREGRIDADRLVDLIVTSQRELQQAKQQLDQAKRVLPASVHEPFLRIRYRGGLHISGGWRWRAGINANCQRNCCGGGIDLRRGGG